MSSSSTSSTIKPTELKIGVPIEYDGNQETATGWLMSIKAYLLINNDVYNNDEKRVAFGLSHMKKAVAQSWATDYYEQALAQNPPSFGTWENFEKEFKKSFMPVDTAGTAIAKLRTLTQKGTVEEYITEFRTHAHQSTIKDQHALIEFFTTGLKTPLVNRIYGMDTVPDTVEGWYEKASHFENQWQKARAIASRSNRTDRPKKKNYSRPSVRERDPDAMDVDAIRLSREDRDKYIKEGRCFNCGNKGHLSRECKGKQPAKGVKRVERKGEEEGISDEERGAVSLVKAARFLGKDF